MRYADLSFKKLSTIYVIIGLLVVLISTTAISWERFIGTFSLPAIGFQFSNNAMSWWYRIQYNQQFPTNNLSSKNGLLALIGVIPPIAPTTYATTTGAEAIPVLLYHGITPIVSGSDTVTIENFKDQLFALKAAGWQTVSIEDFVAAMQGKIILPQKSFLLTFDDGRKDTYYAADPILNALGYTGIMYAITGHSLAPGSEKSHYYLSASELKQMITSGRWEIQSHSRIGHAQYPIDASGTLGDFYGQKLWIPTQVPGETADAYASRVYNDLSNYFTHGIHYPLSPGRLETESEFQSRIAADLLNAKQDIENKLGVDVLSFAYPYNDFAADLRNSNYLTDSVNQIYDVSFYQWYPSLGASENYPGLDGQLLKRIEPRSYWTVNDLMTELNNGAPKSLPYATDFSTNDGWLPAWGDDTISNGVLTLNASTTTAGAMAVLDGSRTWKDYNFSADVDWISGQNIALLTHYAGGPKNVIYMGCNYENGSVKLQESTNGVSTVIAQVANPAIGPGDGKTLGIAFTGTYASCSWNGGIILGATINSAASPSGGIAIEAWDHNLGVARAVIHDVSVTNIVQ